MSTEWKLKNSTGSDPQISASSYQSLLSYATEAGTVPGRDANQVGDVSFFVFYCTLLCKLSPVTHNTPLEVCFEQDQQGLTSRRCDVLVHQITTVDHLECSANERQ